MTPEQIAAVTDTFAAVGTDDTLAVAFYDALFSARRICGRSSRRTWTPNA